MIIDYWYGLYPPLRTTQESFTFSCVGGTCCSDDVWPIEVDRTSLDQLTCGDDVTGWIPASPTVDSSETWRSKFHWQTSFQPHLVLWLSLVVRWVALVFSWYQSLAVQRGIPCEGESMTLTLCFMCVGSLRWLNQWQGKVPGEISIRSRNAPLWFTGTRLKGGMMVSSARFDWVHTLSE